MRSVPAPASVIEEGDRIRYEGQRFNVESTHDHFKSLVSWVSGKVQIIVEGENGERKSLFFYPTDHVELLQEAG